MGTVLDASTLVTSRALESADVGKNRSDTMVTTYLGNPVLCLWIEVHGYIYLQDIYVSCQWDWGIILPA